MHRRTFLLASAAPLAAGVISPRIARAAEASMPQLGELIGSGVADAERGVIAARLRRDSFTISGEPRRKGQLIIVVATQQGMPWRLVIDSRSGEIIGRRALAETAGLPR